MRQDVKRLTVAPLHALPLHGNGSRESVDIASVTHGYCKVVTIPRHAGNLRVHKRMLRLNEERKIVREQKVDSGSISLRIEELLDDDTVIRLDQRIRVKHADTDPLSHSRRKLKEAGEHQNVVDIGPAHVDAILLTPGVRKNLETFTYAIVVDDREISREVSRLNNQPIGGDVPFG